MRSKPDRPESAQNRAIQKIARASLRTKTEQEPVPRGCGSNVFKSILLQARKKISKSFSGCAAQGPVRLNRLKACCMDAH